MHAHEKPERESSPKSAHRHESSQPSSQDAMLKLQRTAGNTAVTEMIQRVTAHEVLRSPGSPLDEPVRAEMEARLGADFSSVRVHTDATARRSAAELGAKAYTSGEHVVIGDGGGDRHTLAHELTHVIQQRGGAVAGTDRGDGLRVSDPSDRFEREAEANATRVLRTPAPGHAPTESSHSAPVPGNVHSVQRMDNLMQGVRRLFAPRLTVESHFAGPYYNAAPDARAGGSHSWAVLGPTATRAANSNANPSLPRAIRPARRAYPRAGFVAGHLLNGDFGGSGQDAPNLTILTSRGNSAHKRFDNRVKDALKKLWDVYDYLRKKGVDVNDGDRFDLGIRIDIQTAGGTWGNTYPDSCIYNGLNCQANISGNLGLAADEQELLSDGDQRTLARWMAEITRNLTLANNNGTIDNRRLPRDSGPSAPRRRGRRRARAGAASQ